MATLHLTVIEMILYFWIQGLEFAESYTLQYQRDHQGDVWINYRNHSGGEVRLPHLPEK